MGISNRLFVSFFDYCSCRVVVHSGERNLLFHLAIPFLVLDPIIDGKQLSDGSVDEIVLKQSITISGWSILRSPGHQSDLVLITNTTDSSQDEIVGCAFDSIMCLDITGRLKVSEDIPLGWKARFICNPTKIYDLKAWGFDFKTGKAYPLASAATC